MLKCMLFTQTRVESRAGPPCRPPQALHKKSWFYHVVQDCAMKTSVKKVFAS